MQHVTLSEGFEQRWSESSRKATECVLNIVRTNDLLLSHIEKIKRPFDLSIATGLALIALANANGPLSPHEISDRLVVTRATITGLLDSLERRGYVQRKPHPTDRRMLLVEITDEGRRVADEVRVPIHRAEKTWMDVLSPQEQETLIQLLWRVQDRLQEHP